MSVLYPCKMIYLLREYLSVLSLYSLKDLPCLVEAATESFSSGPSGDVHMGGTTPLVKNTALAIVLLVGGFPNALLLPRQTL